MKSKHRSVEYHDQGHTYREDWTRVQVSYHPVECKCRGSREGTMSARKSREAKASCTRGVCERRLAKKAETAVVKITVHVTKLQ